MSRIPIDLAGFEAKFRDNPDPWNYASSSFEAFKRRVLLQACGENVFGRGLELACANGQTTISLSGRCLRLLAVDGSQAAIEEARKRTSGMVGVRVAKAALPQDMPRGPFDLIVASEILYYLSKADLELTLDRIYGALAPGGRVVVLHHVVDFDDAACRPAFAQGRAEAFFEQRCHRLLKRSFGRFRVSAFAKSIGRTSG